ncbi:hypothetical protein AN639_02135 [Candidatus Epulonipiscium fishelsonii]|nr:hypothetical protein AN639_02135 [Epulopiscium sp. SCG-B05WGA-EpuloA1]
MTIQDIAELAQVSKATVSRVLNNSGYVNQETRLKVEQIIQEHKYTQKNIGAQKTIGVIIPEIANSFFGEIFQGITEKALDLGFSLIYCDSANNMELEEKAIKMLEKQKVCGIIITPATGLLKRGAERKLTDMIEKLKIPIIVVDREFENSNWDGVFYENFQSTYMATSELLKVGHKHVGIVTGDLNLKIGKLRLEGYLKALADNNITSNYILQGDFSTQTAYTLCKDAFAKEWVPSSFVTCNNYTTLGFMRACKESNLEIGKDISLIAIDHIPVLDAINYPLSCVTRDVVKMGEVATTMLFQRLQNLEQPRQISMIACKLILKGSELLNTNNQGGFQI